MEVNKIEKTNFLTKLVDYFNNAKTENNANAYATTKDKLLDFFAQGGALRTANEDRIKNIFYSAFSEDPSDALRILFYIRDVREGQGERKIFRVVIKDLAKSHPEDIKKNLALISEFGRWDDLYEFVGTPLEKDALEIMKNQFKKDITDLKDNKEVSLLGKWLKSENTSSTESKRLGTITRTYFGISSKDYRKALSALRKKIDVTEAKMSKNLWNAINYERVPSKAQLKYKNAFKKRDKDRYVRYIEAVSKGEKKINASTLYPYEIISKVLYGADADKTLDVLWNNLPNYIPNEENSLAVVDVSGSMTGQPLSVAVSLGMYLAERNKGPFKDYFITFSDDPALVEITGKDIYTKVEGIIKTGWTMSTNIEKVFKLLLRFAVKDKIAPKEMVKRLYIISDMEFNQADNSLEDEKLFETIKRQYNGYGYELPQLVFWNVQARNVQFPMTKLASGVILVSGFSPVLFEKIMKQEFLSPLDFMYSVIHNKRYMQIV